MRAVILAGGKGRRLRPYTTVIPKPLVPLGEITILEMLVRQLVGHGVRRITLAVGYHAELIMAVAGDGSKWGAEIDYSMEDAPLGTVGPLRNIEGLDGPFLVMNGDLLTDLPFGDFAEAHRREHCVASVAAFPRKVKLSLGVLRVNGAARLEGFEEKPEFTHEVSMGIYCFQPRVLGYIPEGEPFGFDQLMMAMLANRDPVHIYRHTGRWLDMGTHDDLRRAQEEFERHPERYLPGVFAAGNAEAAGP